MLDGQPNISFHHYFSFNLRAASSTQPAWRPSQVLPGTTKPLLLARVPWVMMEKPESYPHSPAGSRMGVGCVCACAYDLVLANELKEEISRGGVWGKVCSECRDCFSVKAPSPLCCSGCLLLPELECACGCGHCVGLKCDIPRMKDCGGGQEEPVSLMTSLRCWVRLGTASLNLLAKKPNLMVWVTVSCILHFTWCIPEPQLESMSLLSSQ